MKAICYPQLGKDETKEFECDGFQARTIIPTQHEVILKKNGRDLMLLQVDARPRQGTDPLRYQRIEVLNDAGEIAWAGDIAGTALVEPPVDASGRVYTVDEMRKVLAERKVKYKRSMGLDELQVLLMNTGGMPTAAELDEEVEEEVVDADAEGGYTDEQLKKVLDARKVKYKAAYTNDILLALVMKGGAPTDAELA